MTPSPPDPGPGLRERKKAKTRAAIQEHALRLFAEQGFTETTVDQIAAAAEISPSTFFRYFPSKEETVLYDQIDPVLVESFLRQPAELAPISAMRVAMREVYERLSVADNEHERVRQRLIFSVPELRSVLYEQFASTMRLMNETLARRTGHDADDVAVRAWSGAVIGVVLSTFFALQHDGRDLPDTFGLEFINRVDAGLAQLEAGLPL